MADHPKLMVLFEKLRGMSFELVEAQYTVGRKDSMDICIKDASLSGHHCDLIRLEDGNYMIRDNDSTNGTRVNNVITKEAKLKSSDILQLGGVEVLYDFGNTADTPTAVTRTINLDDLDSNLSTVRELNNYSPFAKQERQKNKRNTLMLYGIIAILALALLAMVGLVAAAVLNI
ncbi:MAG: FHA domain-containing protein [Lentisphaeria bacterium]|nr:FHA domain-containing protein [Lentisphaeria bacterium]